MVYGILRPIGSRYVGGVPQYFYETPEGLTKRNEDALKIWFEAGYELEGNELVLRRLVKRRERIPILAEGEILSILELSRRLRPYVRRVPEAIAMLEREGFIRRIPRRIFLPRFRVMSDYYVETEIEAWEEVDRIPLRTISFDVYPTGEYHSRKKYRHKKLSLRVEKIFVVGERPPVGMSVSDVINAIDWEDVEQELINIAINKFREANPYAAWTNEELPPRAAGRWEWYICDEDGHRVALKSEFERWFS